MTSHFDHPLDLSFLKLLISVYDTIAFDKNIVNTFLKNIFFKTVDSRPQM